MKVSNTILVSNNGFTAGNVCLGPTGLAVNASPLPPLPVLTGLIGGFKDVL